MRLRVEGLTVTWGMKHGRRALSSWSGLMAVVSGLRRVVGVVVAVRG